MLFYVINTLKALFPCVKKMASLYRYYHKIESTLKSTVTTDYILIHAYDALELYNHFKSILGEFIKKPEKYITTEEERQIIRHIIVDELNYFNEEMKNLFLDKYYFPYGKGYGVTLLKEDNFTGSSK
jgi:hypothetical protein